MSYADLTTAIMYVAVCAFPYIMAFAEDLLEIRLVANGSLVHAACIPGLKLLCGRRVSIRKKTAKIYLQRYRSRMVMHLNNA